MKKLCTACGEEFELLPRKPGLIGTCPACSTLPPLNPKEARQAHLARRDESIEKLFNVAIADGKTEDIVKWDILRRKPLRQTKNSN